jgi:hypothetical protein
MMLVRLALTVGLVVAAEAQVSCSTRNNCNSDQYCDQDQQECRTIVSTTDAAARLSPSPLIAPGVRPSRLTSCDLCSQGDINEACNINQGESCVHGQAGRVLRCVQGTGSTGSDGTCVALRNVGESCDTNSPCASTTCCGGTCCQYGHICDDLNGGATPGDLSTGVCTASSSLTEGFACERLGWCVDALYCENGANADAAGVCTQKKQLGQSCENQGLTECAEAGGQQTDSNYCDSTTGQCTARLQLGSPCTTRNQCFMGTPPNPGTQPVQCFGSSTEPDLCRAWSPLGSLCDSADRNCAPLPPGTSCPTGEQLASSPRCTEEVCTKNCIAPPPPPPPAVERAPCVADAADGTACGWEEIEGAPRRYDVCKCSGGSSFCPVGSADQICKARLADGEAGCQNDWVESGGYLSQPVADRWPGVGIWHEDPIIPGPRTWNWVQETWEWVKLGHAVSADRHCQEGSVCLQADREAAWSGKCVATKEIGDACDVPDGADPSDYEHDLGYHSQCPGYCQNNVCTEAKAVGAACVYEYECGYDRKRNQWSEAGQLTCFSGQCKASCVRDYTEGAYTGAPVGTLGGRCAPNEFCASDPLAPTEATMITGTPSYLGDHYGNFETPSACDTMASTGELCGSSTDFGKPCDTGYTSGYTPEPYGWIWDFEAGGADYVSCIDDGVEARCSPLKRNGEMCTGTTSAGTATSSANPFQVFSAAMIDDDPTLWEPGHITYNEQCPLGSCEHGTSGECTVLKECTLDAECGPTKNCVGASAGTPGMCAKRCSIWQRCDHDGDPCGFDQYGNIPVRGNIKECADGEYCEGAGDRGSCLSRKEAGDDCARDEQCVPDVFCYESICTVAKEEGEACERDAECKGVEEGDVRCGDTDDDDILDTCVCDLGLTDKFPRGFICKLTTPGMMQILLFIIIGALLFACCGALLVGLCTLCASSKKKHVDGDEVGQFELNVQKTKAPWKFVSPPYPTPLFFEDIEFFLHLRSLSIIPSCCARCADLHILHLRRPSRRSRSAARRRRGVQSGTK